jgi:hypothetical protein
MKTLDTVALRRSIPEKKLVKGQVGTIVEKLDRDTYEVEFLDTKTGLTLGVENIEWF